MPWPASSQPGRAVVLDRSAPDVWDSNHLRLERPWEDAPEDFPVAVEDATRAFGMRTPVVSIADEAPAKLGFELVGTTSRFRKT